jgi:hypothetical protein
VAAPAQVAAPAPALAQSVPDASEPAPLSQRIGTVGIILLAVLAGVAAYFLSYLVNVGL